MRMNLSCYEELSFRLFLSLASQNGPPANPFYLPSPSSERTRLTNKKDTDHAC